MRKVVNILRHAISEIKKILVNTDSVKVKILHMCMCACIVYASICTRWVPWAEYLHADIRMQRREANFGYLPDLLSTYFSWDKVSHSLRAPKSAGVAGQQTLTSTSLCSPPQCWAHPHTLPQQVFLRMVTIWMQVLMLTEQVLYSCPRLEIEIAIFFQKYSQKHNIHKKVFFFNQKVLLSRVQRKLAQFLV